MRLASAQTGDTDRVRCVPTPELREGGWRDYVAGTAWAMLDAGLPTSGFTGVLESTVPVGAGLSSSARRSSWRARGRSRARPGRPTRPADPRPHRPARRERLRGHALRADGPVRLGVRRRRRGRAPRLPDARASGRAPPGGPGAGRGHTPACPRSLTGSAYNERRAQCEAAVRRPRDGTSRTCAPCATSTLEHARAVRGRARSARPRCARAMSSRRTRGCWPPSARSRPATSTRSARCSPPVTCVAARPVRGELSRSWTCWWSSRSTTPGVVASRMTGAGFGGCTVTLVRAGRGRASCAERDRARLPGAHRTGAASVGRSCGRGRGSTGRLTAALSHRRCGAVAPSSSARRSADSR